MVFILIHIEYGEMFLYIDSNIDIMHIYVTSQGNNNHCNMNYS